MGRSLIYLRPQKQNNYTEYNKKHAQIFNSGYFFFGKISKSLRHETYQTFFLFSNKICLELK